MKITKIAGIECSRIILGTGKFGGAVAGKTAFELMDAYISAGGNVIDTAEVYGDWFPGAEKSPSEKCVGRYLKQRGKSGLVIFTKGAHYRAKDPARVSRVRPECIREDIGKSLDNLFIDCIDFYWLHRDDPAYPVEPIMDALFDAQDQGVISRIGASNWSLERIEEANRYAAACGRTGFEATQTGYAYMKNYVQMGMNKDPDTTMLYFDERRDTAYCTEHQFPVVAYSSQANGYITKYLSGKGLPEKVARSYDYPMNRMRAKRAGKVALELECSPEAVGLAYLFTRPFPVCAIIGPRNLEQLRSSLEAADLELSDEQKTFLERDE